MPGSGLITTGNDTEAKTGGTGDACALFRYIFRHFALLLKDDFALAVITTAGEATGAAPLAVPEAVNLHQATWRVIALGR
jgi:hypothetical protein